MSTTIRVDDKTLARLQAVQLPRESYNDVISRLLGLWEVMNDLRPVLHGSVNYQEWRRRIRDNAETMVKTGDRSD